MPRPKSEGWLTNSESCAVIGSNTSLDGLEYLSAHLRLVEGGDPCHFAVVSLFSVKVECLGGEGIVYKLFGIDLDNFPGMIWGGRPSAPAIGEVNIKK